MSLEVSNEGQNPSLYCRWQGRYIKMALEKNLNLVPFEFAPLIIVNQ
ncbi:hypothetical protein LDG_8993 [Legionella drancourtii LLAP12]|uniref:Uncharacterized protein n=1 Tax=Legionella drancourtii LLAP12 TaxID=658187 RepID=G9EUJ7_9GAMM|nr:hypothetical protein LDG_8993 [Legionella drancourtii LLAP12]